MTYATQDDLVGEYGEREIILLSDLTGAVIDAAAVAKALTYADTTTNGYIKTRYPAPWAQTPAALIPIACKIARYRLATSNGSSVPTKAITDDYNAAIQQLRDISTGKFALPVDAAGTPAPGVGVTKVAPATHVFPASDLADYMPSRGLGLPRRF